MFLNNINNILYVWTIHSGILPTSFVDKVSICNIDKDTFFYMWYRQTFYIRYRQKYLCLYCIWTFCLYIIYTHIFLHDI